MNRKNKGFSAEDLVEAIENKNLGRVKEYVENKRDWLRKALGEDSSDALRIAALNANDNMPLFQYILSELAKLENRHPKDILNSVQGIVGYEYTPLHYAVRFGAPETITQLVNLGADLRVKSHNGRTVLKEALYHGNDLVIEELLRLRPEFLQEFFNSVESLHDNENYLASKRSKLLTALCRGDLPTVESYAEENCYWLQIPLSGEMTALHFAASYGHVDVLSYIAAKLAQDLKKSKSDILNQTKIGNGLTAIDFAIRFGSLELVSSLLDQGVDMSIRTYRDSQGRKYKTSILHNAAWYGNEPVIEELLWRKPELLLAIDESTGKRADECATLGGNNYVRQKKEVLETALRCHDLGLVLQYVRQNSCWLKIPLQQGNGNPQSLQHSPAMVAYCILATPAERIIQDHAEICDLVFNLQREGLAFKSETMLSFSEQQQEKVKAKYSDVFQFLKKYLPSHKKEAAALLEAQVLQLRTESSLHMRTAMFRQSNTTTSNTATTVAPANRCVASYEAPIALYLDLDTKPELYDGKLAKWSKQINILEDARICKNHIYGLWVLAQNDVKYWRIPQAAGVLDQLSLKVAQHITAFPEDKEVQQLKQDVLSLRTSLTVKFRSSIQTASSTATTPANVESQMTRLEVLTEGFSKPLQTIHASQQHDSVRPSNECMLEKTTGTFSS